MVTESGLNDLRDCKGGEYLSQITFRFDFTSHLTERFHWSPSLTSLQNKRWTTLFALRRLKQITNKEITIQLNTSCLPPESGMKSSCFKCYDAENNNPTKKAIRIIEQLQPQHHCESYFILNKTLSVFYFKYSYFTISGYMKLESIKLILINS